MRGEPIQEGSAGQASDRASAPGISKHPPRSQIQMTGAVWDPSFSACYRTVRPHREGGFAFTALIDDRVATTVAAWAMGRRIHPSVLTLGNATLGIGGSVAVFVAAGDGPFSAAVLAGVVLWQAAYVLDCADGQLARAAGRTSAAGARLDATADLAVQAGMLVAVSQVVLRWSHPPVALLIAFAATWCVNLFAFVLAKLTGYEGASLVHSTSRPATIAKLTRDYGAQIALLGAWAVCSPRTLVGPVAGLTAVNAALLLVYLARDAGASIRSTSGVTLGEPGGRK